MEDCREKEDRKDLFRHNDGQTRVDYERRQCCTETQKDGRVSLGGWKLDAVKDFAINSL
jgi:hypothetical protein